MKKLFTLLFAIIMLFCGCESNVIIEDSADSLDLFTPAQTQPRIEKIFDFSSNPVAQSTFVLLEDGSIWYWGLFYKPGNKITNIIYENHSDPTEGTYTQVEKEVTYNDLALIELPQKLEFEGIDLKNNVEDIINLELSTFVLLKNGDLYSFGANTVAGILGDGTTYDRSTPKKILSGVSEIHNLSKGVSSNYPPSSSVENKKNSLSPLERHRYFSGGVMYALKENGDLYSWGYNWMGELYNGTYEDSALPIKIQDNVKSLFCDNWNGLLIEKNDGTLFVPSPSDDVTGPSTKLEATFKTKSEILNAYNLWIDNKNFIGVLYKNGELWHYNKNGQGTLFEKDVKEYNGSEILKTDGTLYKYKNIDEATKMDSNVKTIKGGTIIYNDNSIYTSDLNGNKYRIEKVLTATNSYHINNETKYLYARGFCGKNRALGIELNPGEEFIEVPVQVLFPAGWNK